MQIEDAIGFADLLALRGLLYQLTGDEKVANTKVKMVQAGFGDTPVVDDEDDQALLRRKAVEFLKEYRDAARPGSASGRRSGWTGASAWSSGAILGEIRWIYSVRSWRWTRRCGRCTGRRNRIRRG